MPEWSTRGSRQSITKAPGPRSSKNVVATAWMSCSRRGSAVPAPRIVVTRRTSPPSAGARGCSVVRSEEHTSELQSRFDLVCRLLLEKKKTLQLAHGSYLHLSLRGRGAGTLCYGPEPRLRVHSVDGAWLTVSPHRVGVLSVRNARYIP